MIKSALKFGDIMIQNELTRLIKTAKGNDILRQELLNTKCSTDPMGEFCRVCQNNGFEVYLGELFALGMDMNDSKMRAVNGGGAFEIEGWNDIYEGVLEEIK